MKRIFVIGGGAAGMTAAINSKRMNSEVTIIERLNDVGKKILVTGNGKCNYFNDDMNPKYYHSSSKYDFSGIINETNIVRVLMFMKSLGVEPSIKNGYFYPHSNQAISMVNTLNKELKVKGINVITDEIVNSITKEGKIFKIKTNMNTYECDAVVLATGSKAFYKFDNNSYSIPASFGHTIINVLPSLVQIKCEGKYFKDIKGVRTNAKVSLYTDKELTKESTGELQITEYGISGICAMQLSGLVSINESKNKESIIKVNFLPDLFNTKEELKLYLKNKNVITQNRTITDLLDSLLNYKLSNMFINMYKLTGYESLDEIEDNILNKLCESIISFEIKAYSTNGFNEAQVCSGGVSLDEVNMNTMESKLVSELYFAGEILDVDGDCGGYNLAFAWISGIIAGMNAGEIRD